MADNIVTRLRKHGRLVAGGTNWEAADEIERLNETIHNLEMSLIHMAIDKDALEEAGDELVSAIGNLQLHSFKDALPVVKAMDEWEATRGLDL